MLSLLGILVYIIRLSTAAQHFVVYHAIHHEIQGVQLGSTNFPINCEVQFYESRLISRRCIILPLYAATPEKVKEAALQNLAGVLISLPSGGWHAELQKRFSDLEHELLSSELSLPIYFVFASEQLASTLDDLMETFQKETTVGGIAALASIWSTGYRMVVQPLPHKRDPGFRLINIEGQLGVNTGTKLPVLLICAHYDALSAIPALSYGADSSASGVVVLLELARIFSRLFASNSHSPKFELMFLLSGGGKYNYLGTKHWLDRGSEDFSELALLDSIAHVICLEGLGSSEFADNLYVHLSRTPKEGSFSSNFIQLLKVAFKSHSETLQSPSSSDEPEPVHFVHKKINLNQGTFSWEHERFALHRLPGLTLSAWPSVQVANRLRFSSLDGGPLYHIAKYGEKYTNRSSFYGSVNPSILARNVRVIAEALSRVIFPSNITFPSNTDAHFISPHWVSETGISALLDLMVRRPRSSQLLEYQFKETDDTSVSLMSPSTQTTDRKWPGLIGTLEYLMSSHLQNVRVLKHPFSTTLSQLKSKPQQESNPGKRKEEKETEFTDSSTEGQSMRSSLLATADFDVVLYSGMEPVTLTIYRLKSSMFDLLIAGLVALYLAVWYFVLEHFHLLAGFVSRMCIQKAKTN